MKQKFSTRWQKSRQPRKKRKYIANAPLHIKKKFVRANLSKELKKKHGRRNVQLRKGDKVKIMRGKFKKKQGKVLSINLKNQKVIIEGIQAQKRDGTKVSVPISPSNLQIIELNLEDKKRIKSINKKEKEKKNASQETKNT